MRQWSAHFTCIAPDIPGFGESRPLALDQPAVADFADAILAFCDAAGIPRMAAYGFHSGAIILMHCMARQPERFSALALCGYGLFTPEEQVRLGDPYTPPNPPRDYGEHLVWMWNRILEQSWYFPWFDPADDNRLPFAHDDPIRLQAVALDFLASADAYRHGYGAVLRANNAIPAADSIMPPVLLTAYDGDPLQGHFSRFGLLPAGWQALPVTTPQQHCDESLAFLLAQGGTDAPPLPREDSDAGFIAIATDDFDGLIHWQGRGHVLALHGPGGSLEIVDQPASLRVDLPGHGLSDPWVGPPPQDRTTWQAVIDALTAHFGTLETRHFPLLCGDPALLYPDLTPDRFGSHLIKAWGIVRAARIFAPWYMADADHTRSIDPAALAPERLALAHRALVRSSAARELHLARQAGRIV